MRKGIPGRFRRGHCDGVVHGKRPVIPGVSGFFRRLKLVRMATLQGGGLMVRQQAPSARHLRDVVRREGHASYRTGLLRL